MALMTAISPQSDFPDDVGAQINKLPPSSKPYFWIASACIGKRYSKPESRHKSKNRFGIPNLIRSAILIVCSLCDSIANSPAAFGTIKTSSCRHHYGVAIWTIYPITIAADKIQVVIDQFPAASAGFARENFSENRSVFHLAPLSLSVFYN
jgi:hypothetical protein